MIIINNKIHRWLQDRKGQDLQRDMIPQERGLKGIHHFIIFYLPIIFLMERSGYMCFLGKGHVVLYFQVNIQTHFWVVWGFIHCSLFTLFIMFSPFTLSLFHSLLLKCHSSFILFLGLGYGGKFPRMKPLFVGCSNFWCIPSMN